MEIHSASTYKYYCPILVASLLEVNNNPFPLGGTGLSYWGGTKLVGACLTHHKGTPWGSSLEGLFPSGKYSLWLNVLELQPRGWVLLVPVGPGPKAFDR